MNKNRTIIFTLIFALFVMTPLTAYAGEAVFIVRNDADAVKHYTTYKWNDNEPAPSILNALIFSLESAGIDHETEYDGTFIKSIDGLENGSRGENSGWMWGYNGYAADVGAGDQGLEDGDIILWKFASDWKKFGSLTDIDSSWARDKVLFLKALGIINGVSFTVNEDFSVTGEYMPDKIVTRAEYMQVLCNLVGNDEELPYDEIFDDVKKEAWYAKAAMFGYQYGYLKGVPNKDDTLSFKPDEPITRQDMATILYRLYADTIEDIPAVDPDTKSRFEDLDSISEYAIEAVETMQELGYINGYLINDKYYFRPKQNASRAEMASMLYPVATDWYGLDK